MHDVHVVGGGPAGCFAGIAACQKGENVILSEEHAKIGEPQACSGLVSRSGLEALEPYVDYRKAMLNEISSASIASGREELLIRPKKETAVLISRSKFDSLAAERFVSEGGKLQLGSKVGKEYLADCIVGADGPASSVAERFNFPKIGRFVACTQGNFAYRAQDPHCAYLYLSSREFPGFFGWAIPINEEEAEIGVGVSMPKHHPMKYYRQFLTKLGVKGKGSGEFSAIIPIGVRARTAKRVGKRNVLLCGDSAGQAKATTGGGIFFGCSCALLAGKHSGEPEEYEKEWQAKFGLDLALHSHLRSILDMGGGGTHPAILTLAKSLLMDELLSENGKMDRWGGMLSPSVISSYAKILMGRLDRDKYGE
jgi:flavin-dependent dehydrogenase